jgi:hypothetical protein
VFDIHDGRITLPLATGRDADLRPGGSVKVELETHDMKRSTVDGVVAWGEYQLFEGGRPEMREVCVLIERGDGVEALGRFTRDHRRVTERVYRARRLVMIAFLPDRERERVVQFRLSIASEKRCEPRRAVAYATRALRYATGADRETALFHHAKARHELGEHALALDDWNAVLSRFERPFAVLGRARTRLALGDRAGGFADARRAAELGVDDAVSLVKVLAPPPSNRVRHKTFGEGTIVKRLDGDKLEIEFADGIKTLAARFVEPIA